VYQPVIGMEVHVQLTTASKAFCGCSAAYASAPPNTLTCPVCLGLPGVLPVINRQAVEYSIMTGLALNCHVPHFTKWDRKNYSYPDLAKGYQISQYDLPITRDGWLLVRTEEGERRIRIRRAHLEEDTAKLVHVGGRSYIDFNRSGVPLIEIVSEPDMHSAEEARQYLVQLRSILRYLGVSTGNMEEGAMRCEANVSLRPEGSTELPSTYVEVKNLNSFRAVKAAVEYEIERQARILDAGGKIERVTMGWDDARGVTVVQRSKEQAHDYRYFPDPDLPPLEVDREWVEELRSRLPELPDARSERLVRQYGLTPYDAALLTEERALADYYEDAVAAAGDAGLAKPVANLITGPMFRLMNQAGATIEQVKVRPGQLAELARLVEAGEVNLTTGRQVLEDMFNRGVSASVVIREKGLGQITDEAKLEELARQAVADNPRAVEDFRAGKTQAVKFLIGQVMRATRGQANPQTVEEILRRILEG
jgi:aspartyl-tRNA(Asn)/glutamyl-tRNA(Gln) amidotransferase subunit B